jgi:hypothetical protein
MTHRIELRVSIDLDHIEGKFASREAMIESLVDELEGAEPSTIDGLGEDGMTSYTVSSWGIEEIERPKPVRRRKSARPR